MKESKNTTETHQCDDKTFFDIVDKYYNNNLGFGVHKSIAINLLKQITSILNEFNISHCLISGTLLGYVRHNDFIPWDDDIDILVDNTIIDKIDSIIKKYNHIFTFMNPYTNIYKLCFLNNGIEMTTDNHGFKKTIIGRGKYNWPFIDLFVYTVKDDSINFFNKEWPKDKFLPFMPVDFLGIDSNIPTDHNYFLKLNYNDRYMTDLISSWYSHKTEKTANIKDILSISLELYNYVKRMIQNNE